MPSPGHPICQGLSLLQPGCHATCLSPRLLSSCACQAVSHVQTVAFSCPRDRPRELKQSQTLREGCDARSTSQGLEPTHGCLGPGLCHTQHSVPGLGQTHSTLHPTSCPKLFPPHFIAPSHYTLPLLSQHTAFPCPSPGVATLAPCSCWLLKPFFQKPVRVMCLGRRVAGGYHKA